MTAAEPDPTLPTAWIIMFLLLVLGLGAAAVLFVGGEIIVGMTAVGCAWP